MTDTLDQMLRLTEAWMRFERAVEAADGEWTEMGHMIRSSAVEMAMSDLRDELVQAGVINYECDPFIS